MGVAFHSGVADGYLRALEVDTGKTLWRYNLPHAGQSTPMIYRAPDSGLQTLIVTLPESSNGPGSPIGVDAIDDGGYVFAFRLKN